MQLTSTGSIPLRFKNKEQERQWSVLRRNHGYSFLETRHTQRVAREIFGSFDQLESVQELPTLTGDPHIVEQLSFFVSSLVAGIEDRKTLEMYARNLLDKFYGPKAK